ncbi:MAG: SDR family NAD(P)-dependent oxidoreductase, partial [Nitrospina sp.]
MRLKNKTAIITGGATGIGLACARLFQQEGARVALFGRRQDRLDQAKKILGESAMTFAGDITRQADIDRLVR